MIVLLDFMCFVISFAWFISLLSFVEDDIQAREGGNVTLYHLLTC